MKINRFITSVAVISMLFSCNVNKENEQQSLEDISKQELVAALEERDRLLALVKDISAGMEQIKQLENIMAITAAHPKENSWQKAQILADISSLKEKIKQRKKQLADIETRLHESTINSKELQETIEALQIQIDSQIDEIESLRRQLTVANEQIDVLSDVVDSLNCMVSTVTTERDIAQNASVKLENELNTCYYVVATKSDLLKHHIIESGFLRKTKLMKGDFDKGFFVISDKRIFNVLPLNTKKARILTTHPETSYEMTEEYGNKVIKITNADEFWSLTDYLVIQKE